MIFPRSRRKQANVVGVRQVENGRWVATLKGKYLGTFDTETEAAKVVAAARALKQEK